MSLNHQMHTYHMAWADRIYAPCVFWNQQLSILVGAPRPTPGLGSVNAVTPPKGKEKMLCLGEV